MLPSRLTFAFAVAVLASLATIDVAHANCGLDYCPLPEDQAQTPTLGRVQLVMRHVDFDLPAGEGSYVENLLRLEVQRFRHWSFGAWIAPVMLSVNDEQHTGFSNPVFFVERRQPVRDNWRLLAGIQLELPMGDRHNGIASGHSELLSYVGLAYRRPSINVQVQGGFANSLSEGHAHVGGNAIYVNPHADHEGQIRASVTVPMLDGRLQPSAFLNGRVVMEETAAGEDSMFLTGALGTSYQVTDAARLQAQFEVPVTAAERFNWRAGIGVGYTL